MKRKIIKIDEEKCNGCGACVPNCAEGALQIIDGKARLISDLFCDGLGACIGHCPEGAILIEEREAEEYNERKVMEENIVKAGENTIKEHLLHLKEHGEMGYYNEAIEYLKEKNIKNPLEDEKTEIKKHSGCPGSKMLDMRNNKTDEKEEENGKRKSHLKQWPVQLHLLSPYASYFKGEDLLIAADCTAFSVADFHKDYLKGKSLAIACPKLDTNKEVYVEKIKLMIDEAKVNTITVMMMEVPCCGGLLQLVKEALSQSSRKVPIKKLVIGIDGSEISEEWV